MEEGGQMINHRLPPFAKRFAEARACGQVPRRLAGVHLAVTLVWDEYRTGAVPRVCLPADPATYDLRFIAGLDVLLSYTARDADRVACAVDALLAADAETVETVHHGLREVGAPMDSWLSVFGREASNHAA